MSAPNTPWRAWAIASSSRSVANTWIGRDRPRASSSSISTIASEYASSPVVQPAHQARIGSSCGLLASSSGTSVVAIRSNTSGSRKKLGRGEREDS